jgi:hypothetical protein
VSLGDSLLKTAISGGYVWRGGSRLAADGVAQPLQPPHQALLDAVPLGLVERDRTQVPVGLASGGDVVPDHQEGVAEGDQGALLATAGRAIRRYCAAR